MEKVMKYIALLRGINVGGKCRVEMKILKAQFERLGFSHVATYINSGNIVFTSSKKIDAVQKITERMFAKEYTFPVRTLIKTSREMRAIAKAIPKSWKQDSENSRSDVAYLFKEVDSKESIKLLPMNPEVVNIKYVKGAILWNLRRSDYGKARLNKLIGTKIYKSMTMRNINTAKYLATL